MNSKYLYLSINFFSILIPFLCSFYPKAPFYKKWKYLTISTSVTAIFFILWDALFTKMGVWGFNPVYITGYYILGLPVEEILFFICIPYACVFTYHIIQHVFKKDYLYYHQVMISNTLIITLMVIGCYHIHKLYTGVTFLLTAFFLAFLTLKVKPPYLSRFYFTFLIILIPFLIVNGILTGSFIEDEVVWYNNDQNLGIRIGTIPVEDVFYGMLMILINISIFEKLLVRSEGKR